jgi:Flp pilus assembly protein TadG
MSANRRSTLVFERTLSRTAAAVARLRRAERGQAVVEFALIVPILLLIVMGILDFGRVFYTYEALANAAREGARFCALHPGDANGTKARVAGELGGRVTPDLAATSCPSASTVAAGDPVSVSASATVDLITPLMGSLVGDPVTITASATMSVWLQ